MYTLLQGKNHTTRRPRNPSRKNLIPTQLTRLHTLGRANVATQHLPQAKPPFLTRTYLTKYPRCREGPGRGKKWGNEWDSWGRLLRYIYLPNGTCVNTWLVANGYARAADYSPDTRY